MKQITFTPGNWEQEGLELAYSWRFEELPEFVQEADCIRNSASLPGSCQNGGYDYMGLMLPETYGAGTKLTVRCSFAATEGGSGAPMLTIADRCEVDENGVLRTLDYYEVVIWHRGMNLWRLHTEDRQVHHYLVAGLSFPLKMDTMHTLSAELKDNRMMISVDDQMADLFVSDMPEQYRIGYTACEGICKLFDMTVEEVQP